VKLRLAVPPLRRSRRKRRRHEQAPKEIVPKPVDPFDVARERLKRQISPPGE
jgi:hypothetical protein